MKATPNFTPNLFLMHLTLFFSHVLSQGFDSCNSLLNFPISSNVPFETTSLHCATVWPSQNFILRYAQESQNVWNFLLLAPNRNSYVGIGFSPDGNMVGSRAIVGWVGSNGNPVVRKYFLGGKSPNLVVIEQPNQGLQVVNISMIVQSNQVYVVFQLISDSPPSMHLIYAVGQMGQLPTGPNFQLSQHQTMTSTVLDYATGQFQSQTSPDSSLRRGHGLLTMLGWAILLPIGAMVARYLKKWDPIWFYSHAAIQSLGFVLGLIGIFCGLILENQINASVDIHKAIGIIILTLGCLQVFAILGRPYKTSKVRKYWNWYHFSVGGALIILAAVNVFYGIHLGNGGSDWNAGFAFVLVTLFIICLIRELKSIFKE